MKILLATETYLPTISGVVVFTQNIAEELVARGHEVAIFAPSSHRVYGHEIKNGIHIYRFPSFPVPFRMSSRFMVRQYRRVQKAYHEFGPDVVHLQSPSGVPAAVQRCARRDFVPVIATHHFALEFIMAYLKPLAFISSLTQRALVGYLNQFYRKCDYVTCPTQNIKKNLIEAGIKVPLHVISNGVSLSHFNSADHHESSEKAPLVLYVGRVDQDKNIPVFLDALPEVLEKVAARVVIAGGGNKLSASKRWVRDHDLASKVSFTGKIPHRGTQLQKLFLQASVFVVPSLIETQSLGTLEALACGVPVVASDAGALPELVHHGKNGYLVSPSAPEEFAQYIIKLLEDPELRETMGAAGREIVSHHNLSAVVSKFLHVYEGNR